MSARRNQVWMVLVLLGAIVARNYAWAQTSASPTLYRLNQGSTFQQGCFPPCLCPVMIAQPIAGTFVLTPTSFGPLFSTYAVTDVNWVVSLDGTPTLITGSGTYKFGGEFALQQELSLDLKVGTNKVEHFDSGLVAGPVPFPDIKVSISINGQVCFDTVFDVSASPVPLNQIRPYRLLPGSTFTRGCFGACECADFLAPIGGTFGLVPIQTTPLAEEFALVNVRWLALGPSGQIPVRGYGIYQIGAEVASQQELSMLLQVGDEAPALFDSGLVSGGGEFPLLDISVSVRGAVCFNTWIDLQAAPVAPGAASVKSLVPKARAAIPQ